MSNNFIADKRKGKIGERAVSDFFIKKGYFVEDVSENKDFQKLDIDLIVDNEFIEVKTQNSINKNNKITLELECNYYEDLFVKGWFAYTEANIIVFYDKVNNIAYHIKTDELRELFEEYKDTFDIYDFDEDYKVSTLAYIDIDFLKEKSKSLEIHNYNFLTA